MLRLSCALLGLAASLAGMEPLLDTPFEVRREWKELAEELEARSPASAADPSLLERAQRLMAAHGEHLASSAKGAVPLTEAVAALLQARGQDAAFAEAYGAVAASRLASIGSDPTALRRIATAYPFTQASREAWARLADRAWDRGQLGDFLACTGRAGPVPDGEGRAQRLAAAKTLLADALPRELPRTLAIDEEMWRIPLEGRAAAPRRPGLRALDRQGGKPVVAFSAPLDDCVALSLDGRLLVVDRLQGRLLGNPCNLGGPPGSHRQAVPAVLRDAFAAVGVVDQARLAITCVDRQGQVRWRMLGPPAGFNPLVSAPVAIGNLVAVAAVLQGNGASDLRVLAWHALDGTPAFDRLVARIGGAWHAPLDAGGIDLSPQLLLAHGRLLLLSNSGLVARLSSAGRLERLWTYPSVQEDPEAVFSRPTAQRRSGLAVCGTWTVATPADAHGLTLLLPAEGDPILYGGDGAGGAVVGASADLAFLATNGALVALDPETQRPRWNRSLPREDLEGIQVEAGNDRLLAISPQALRLLDPASGQELELRRLPHPVAACASDGMLMLANREILRATGTSAPFLAKLEAAARAAPRDARPQAALAALLAARGREEEALDRWEQALALGEDPAWAEQAARLLRRRIELAEEPTPWLARWDRLARHAPSLAAEGAWWHARTLALQGQTEAAKTLLLPLLRNPPQLVTLQDRVAVDLACLAALGLERLGAPNGDGPLPYRPRPAPGPAPAPTRAWQRSLGGSGRPQPGPDRIYSYQAGLLAAFSLEDGTLGWERAPLRPLLGVSGGRGEEEGGGVRVAVIPGSAAEAAGVRDGDVLRRFNGRPLRSFTEDLVPAVQALPDRAPFVLGLRRGDQELQVAGRLGGEPVRAVAADAGVVLVWPLQTDRQGHPEGQWFAVHEAATGRYLWRHALPPLSVEGPPAPPLLADGLVLTADGSDLVGIPVHPAGDEVPGLPRWRLPGLASHLDLAWRSDHLLWLPDPDSDSSSLVDLRHGRLLARLPGSTEPRPQIDGATVVSRGPGGQLACHDLASGRRLWQAAGLGAPLDLGVDTVLALDTDRRLVALDRFSGALRRRYGEWDAVQGWAPPCAGTLVLHTLAADGRQMLAGVAVAGGAILWQHPLPPRCELQALLGNREGIAITLGQPANQAPLPDGPWPRSTGAIFAADGRLLHLMPLGDGKLPVLLPLAGGGLGLAADRMQAEAWRLPAPGTALACPELGPDWQAPAALGRLAWRDCGDSAWALGRSGGRLLVFARGAPMNLRLGSRGGLIDADDLLLHLPVTGQTPVLSGGEPTRAWRLVSSWDQGRDGLRAAILAPPLVREAARGLAVRADDGRTCDGDAAPWWYKPAWHLVPEAP